MRAEKKIDTSRTHVVKRGDKWAIRKEGSKRVIRLYDSREEAIKSARKRNKKEGDIVIHKKDGSIFRWEKSI